MQNVALNPSRRSVEFGIYRDGDNNLDLSQGAVLGQALQTSAKDADVQFTVQDTTGVRLTHGDIVEGKVRTDSFTIQDGGVADAATGKAHDMADPKNLAQFVATTLDNAEKSGARQTWIDLVDHGAGDGGGLEADSFHAVMPMPQISQAIADGEKMHAQAHPEDADRRIDGVVANQCLMASMGFADALSRAGVKYLAASPETMLSPGTPTTVAESIAKHLDDPSAMAKNMVDDVMRTRYGDAPDRYGPAAAFDVLDLAPEKIANAEHAIKRFNDDLAGAARSRETRSAVREDVRAIDGMVRFPGATRDMPWHADRPAMAVYDTIASDGRLDDAIRSDAKAASQAVAALVLAHRESDGFAPFGGAGYTDAAGPTIHAPVKPSQIDSWAPSISETNNAFYDAVDQAKFVRVVA
jgi:hypothetical protein